VVLQDNGGRIQPRIEASLHGALKYTGDGGHENFADSDSAFDFASDETAVTLIVREKSTFAPEPPLIPAADENLQAGLNPTLSTR
jgi:hypothetical protein